MAAVSFVHHPVFQSLLLPVLLCLACLGVLRLALGAAHRPWSAFGATLGLLLAWAHWPGFDWPVSVQAHKLPWTVLASALLVLAALRRPAAARESARAPWRLAALLWLACVVWLLGPVPWWLPLLVGAAGAAALAVLARSVRAPLAEPTGAAGSAAALTVALLGLLVLGGLAGSLLLAQLALMVALASAVLGLWAWAWPRSGLRVGAAALLPLGTAGLVLACLVGAGGRVHWAALVLVALALGAPWWGARRRWSGRHWRWRPLVVAALAALPVLAALGAQLWLAPAASEGGDLYYTPRW